MKYICNNKEQYLLSLVPVSNNFDIKYLFINELKESIKISEDITILVNKLGINSILTQQFKDNNINYILFDLNDLPIKIFEVKTKYCLILNVVDAIILKDLDDKFINHFKQIDGGSGILASATNSKVIAFDFEEGRQLLVDSDFKYADLSICFGLTDAMTRYISYINDQYLTNQSFVDACQYNSRVFISTVARLSLSADRYEFDYNNELFTTVDYSTNQFMHLKPDETIITSTTPYFNSNKLL